MAILRMTTEAEAAGLTAEIYEDDRRSLGYVPSHTKALSLNPEAYLASEALLKAVSTSLGLRRYELVTLADSQAIGSTHCMLAHGKKSLHIFSEEQLRAIARDFHDAGLPEAEVAMMDYAVQLCLDAAAMTDEDTQRLRDLGFGDREIVHITMAAAARNFISRSVLAMAVDLDVPKGMSEDPIGLRGRCCLRSATLRWWRSVRPVGMTGRRFRGRRRGAGWRCVDDPAGTVRQAES